MQRLRRFAPGLIGLALAAVIVWRGAIVLEAEAESSEPFTVRVPAPAAVIDLGGPPELLTWQALVTPIEERERVELRVDGSPVEFAGDADAGELLLRLDSMREQPGWHFIEVGLDRRGGRSQRVIDPVLIGQFARPAAAPNKSCALVLTLSPALIDSLLVPLLERELLPILQANEHMGPDTVIHEAKLALRDDGLSFELELRGINTLAVAGAIVLRVIDERRLAAELAILTEVDFRGQLRNQARGIGAGGGALIGGLISGPVGLVGAAAGWIAADVVVTKKARELIREQIEAGLKTLEGVELLPTHVELIGGRPQSRVAIGFCELTRVRKTGLSAGLYAIPDPPEGAAERFDLGVPGPLVTGARPATEALTPDEHLRVELSIDAVNALLTAWTQSGLLAELLGEREAIERANAELEAWTPLRLGRLRPTRPPTLNPIGGPSAGWRFGIGGLVIEVTGVEEQPWGQMFVAAAGELSPTWDPQAGALSLAGSLDTFALTCARPSADGQPSALHGCFSEVLEAVEVREGINEQLRPGAHRLPSLAIASVLDRSIGVQIDALALARPQPGVLRLSAQLRPRE